MKVWVIEEYEQSRDCYVFDSIVDSEEKAQSICSQGHRKIYKEYEIE
jgi:hypothetical protein